MSYSKDIAVELHGIEKHYRLYKKPIDRLLQFLPWNKNKALYDEFIALQKIDLTLYKGEVLGVVGQNGAGKSTLLQIICDTLEASSGTRYVNGTITALLELGSGFNPEFTGHENIYMAGAISGLSKEQIDEKYEDIIEFANIGEHIYHPVKTYSSGMMVRLAFSVATSVMPDILVVDEALSVGDGAFAKKSFDRIMELKEAGCTILFCSHNTYQVEVFCDKAIWLKNGQIAAEGSPANVVDSYLRYLEGLQTPPKEPLEAQEETSKSIDSSSINKNRILKVDITVNQKKSEVLELISEVDDLDLNIRYKIDTSHAIPTIAVVFTDENMKNISSSLTYYDNIQLKYDENGEGDIHITYPKISLLRGKYLIHVLLMCENAIHIYNSVECGVLNITQKGSEVGIVSLNRSWS